MKKILSIDGGGIRGIIPGMYLVALEERLKQQSKNPEAAIVDYFDFFAGTSTGGILTCLLLCPSHDDSTRPRYSAKEALQVYLDHGTDIFHAGFLKKLTSRLGISSERYQSKTLESILEQYFGDTKLSQLIKPCIITAYNIELRKTHFFRQQTAISRGDIRDFHVKDVCRATSAAPTYFSVAEVYSLAGVRYPLLDGGVFATNPSLSGLIEVTKAFNQTRINDIFIFSMGTGRSKKSYDYDLFKKSSSATIVPALIDIMMSGVAETSNFFLEQLFKSVGKEHNYIRIEPKYLHSIEEELDAASPTNIKKLLALADRSISENSTNLDELVSMLVNEHERDNTKNKWPFLSKNR